MNGTYRGQNGLSVLLGLIAVGLGLATAVIGVKADSASLIALGALLVLFGLLLPQSLKVANQWERAVVLRLGKLEKIAGPGVFFVIPVIDQVAVWLDQRIQATEFNAEQALSKDTVPVDVDAVVFWQIHDPQRAALEIADYRQAINRVAQTSLREMVGSSLLSALLSRSETLACRTHFRTP